MSNVVTTLRTTGFQKGRYSARIQRRNRMIVAMHLNGATPRDIAAELSVSISLATRVASEGVRHIAEKSPKKRRPDA